MPSGHGDKDELVELFRDEFVELFKPAELAGRVSSAAAACTSNSHVVLIREIFRLYRRQMERCDSSAGWCAGELCRKGAMEKGPEGDPAMGSNMGAGQISQPWHRWGKPYWSAARDEYVDDLVCTKCLKPRPSPLPVVPCVLLPQDYYRLAGTKPKDWGAAPRKNIVIRAQESETLPMHQDLPRWKVRHKVRKGTAEYRHSHGNQDESGQKPHHARHRKVRKM